MRVSYYREAGLANFCMLYLMRVQRDSRFLTRIIAQFVVELFPACTRVRSIYRSFSVPYLQMYCSLDTPLQLQAAAANSFISVPGIQVEQYVVS